VITFCFEKHSHLNASQGVTQLLERLAVTMKNRVRIPF
jgi:hypothetical protein